LRLMIGRLTSFCSRRILSRKSFDSISTLTCVILYQIHPSPCPSIHRVCRRKHHNMAHATIHAPRDPNTLSNYNNWRTNHTTTNFEILFEEQRLTGNVVLTLKSITNAETKEIILDTSYLDISEIKVNGEPASYELLPRMEPYGSALKILLERGIPADQNVEVLIYVSTTKSCTALQWLTPAQTSDKKYPYMFSQCEAIHARSIFPCQDTPDVKSPFIFNITSPLPVIASGIPSPTNPTSPSVSGKPERSPLAPSRHPPLGPAPSLPPPPTNYQHASLSSRRTRKSSSRPPKRSSTPTLGNPTTSSSSRHPFPTVAWKILSSPSQHRPSSPATARTST
jgi:Peptidase M1 N-terminal domain